MLTNNPIRGFEIDPNSLKFAGEGLQRPDLPVGVPR